jgi:hypothetical protein
MLHCEHGWLASAAWAGGSNYGVTAGALPQVAGKVAEWPVPPPKRLRDPSPRSRPRP